MNSTYRKVKAWVTAHKFYGGIIILALLFAVYYAYLNATAPSTAPKYETTTVVSGTVVGSMDETGQVSASSNISVESQAGGEVLSVPVTPGEHVEAGAALATIDPTTEQEAVQSAEQDLESAQISLEQLEQPVATSTMAQDQNSVASAQNAVGQDQQTSYNDTASAFLDLPTVIAGLNTILHGYTVPGRTYEENENAYEDIVSPFNTAVNQYESQAESSYQTAYTAYQQNLSDFNATPRSASASDIESLTQESYQTAAQISDALKATTDFLNFVDTTLTNQNLNVPSTIAGQLSTLATYTTSTNGEVSTLSNDANSFATSQGSLTAAEATLSQDEAGPTSLSIQSDQLGIQEKQEALATAQENLAETVVRAPFSGTVAAVAIQPYQTIGDGTAVATMVSDNQEAQITLNEVDAAKLQVGQAATLTFDAIPNVTIAGTVSEIQTLGTVTSGVVSYTADIVFNTPNAQVLPGMSVDAAIVTGTQTGLLVPSGAVKTVGTQNYVQVFTPPLQGSSSTVGVASKTTPTNVPVTTGLSDDTNTVITAGLTQGEQVVTGIVTGIVTTGATTKTAAAASTSLFGAGGGRGGGGGGGGGAEFRAGGI